MSRNGDRIVFAQSRPDGGYLLATRLLDEDEVTVLEGTEDATYPFFSPDGASIGFFADGQLSRISVLGGRAVPLAPVDTREAAVGVMTGTSWRRA
jgi:hypothetical protein